MISFIQVLFLLLLRLLTFFIYNQIFKFGQSDCRYPHMKIQSNHIGKRNVNSNKPSKNVMALGSSIVKQISRIRLIKKSMPQRVAGKRIFKYVNKNSCMTTDASEDQVKEKQQKAKFQENKVQICQNNSQASEIEDQKNQNNNQQKHDIQIQKVGFENYGIHHLKNSINQPDFLIYTNDIIKHLLKNQNHFTSKDLFSLQTQITPSMRATLIEWLIQVHYKFQLLPETIFLSINIVDRILTNNFIPKPKFQLVGITSLFIASKYEEIRVPNMQFFVSVGSSAYTKQQMISMEGKIMLILAFQMGYSSPLRFIDKTCLITQLDEQVKQLAYAIVEICLLNIKIYGYRSSLVAEAAIIISLAKCEKNLAKQKSNLDQLIYYQQLQQCIGLIQDFLIQFKNSRFEETFKVMRSKYAMNKSFQNLFI